jgi:NAD-dependent deacetylase
MAPLDDDVVALVADAARRGPIVALTGAGVSAASGIPTFRGPEGYWTVGSAVHRPEELATRRFFDRNPDDVWAWYLHRLGVCRAAEPNPAHEALATLERELGDRFLLVTQNVDGLHLRAGSSLARTHQVHGSIAFLRCAAECRPDLVPIPDGVAAKAPGETLTDDERALLRCPACGGPGRPHVLWFDETYDEERYRFHSSLIAAAEAALLITAGTSGATNLPNLMVREAVRSGAALVDVNPEPNPFGDLAARLDDGAHVRAPATEALPAIVEVVLRAARG